MSNPILESEAVKALKDDLLTRIVPHADVHGTCRDAIDAAFEKLYAIYRTETDAKVDRMTVEWLEETHGGVLNIGNGLEVVRAGTSDALTGALARLEYQRKGE